jgi:nitrite reductase/ring-hydroxylating ferredoxin subunit
VVPAACTRGGAGLSPDPGDASLRCRADGSEFRREDGAVLDGPATTPIPRFEAWTVADGVEVRSPGPAA